MRRTMLPAPPTEACRPKPRVLLVEDDEDTRFVLEDWLRQRYEVVSARDGVEGIEKATAPDAPPDVVITDVWMPVLDGVEMVARMKRLESLRRVPVIFLTAHTAAAGVIAGIQAGARAYLAKPVSLEVLDRKLRSALRHRGIASSA